MNFLREAEKFSSTKLKHFTTELLVVGTQGLRAISWSFPCHGYYLYSLVSNRNRMMLFTLALRAMSMNE